MNQEQLRQDIRRSVDRAFTNSWLLEDCLAEVSRIFNDHFSRNGGDPKGLDQVAAEGVAIDQVAAEDVEGALAALEATSVRPTKPDDVTPASLGRGVGMVTIYKVVAGEMHEMQASVNGLTNALADGWTVRNAGPRPTPTGKIKATAPAAAEEIPESTVELSPDLSFLDGSGPGGVGVDGEVAGRLEKLAEMRPLASSILEPVKSEPLKGKELEEWAKQRDGETLEGWIERYIPERFAGQQVRKSMGAAKAVVGEVPSSHLHKAAIAAGFDLECLHRDGKKPCRGNNRDCPVRLERQRLAGLDHYPLRRVKETKSCWGGLYAYGA